MSKQNLCAGRVSPRFAPAAKIQRCVIAVFAVILELGVWCPEAAGDIIQYAKAGDEKGVVRAIIAGADVDSRDEHGATALHWAAAQGHANIVLRLWMAGASPTIDLREDVPSTSSTMRDGDLPLGVAVRAGHVAVVKTFTKRLNRAQLDLRNHAKETALVIAANTGQTEILSNLIVSGASLDLKGGEPRATALYHAARNGHAAVVEELLGSPINPLACKGAAPNAGVSLEAPRYSAETPRQVARRNGYLRIVELIFRCGGIPEWLRLLGAFTIGLFVFVFEELLAWCMRWKTKGEPKALLPIFILLAVIVAVFTYNRPSDLNAFLADIYYGSLKPIAFLILIFLSGGVSFARAIRSWNQTDPGPDSHTPQVASNRHPQPLLPGSTSTNEATTPLAQLISADVPRASERSARHHDSVGTF